MIEAAQSTAASLIHAILLIAVFTTSIWTGSKLANQFAPLASERLGCLLVALIALPLMIGSFFILDPAISALKQVSCKGAPNYRICMDYD